MCSSSLQLQTPLTDTYRENPKRMSAKHATLHSPYTKTVKKTRKNAIFMIILPETQDSRRRGKQVKLNCKEERKDTNFMNCLVQETGTKKEKEKKETPSRVNVLFYVRWRIFGVGLWVQLIKGSLETITSILVLVLVLVMGIHIEILNKNYVKIQKKIRFPKIRFLFSQCGKGSNPETQQHSS